MIKYARDLKPGDVFLWRGYPADVLDIVHWHSRTEISIEANGRPIAVFPMVEIEIIGKMPC